MIAARVVNAELAAELPHRDADTSLVDGNGFNAFRIAIDRACVDERFARGKLPGILECLAPPSIDVQVDGHLVKLDRRLMEYLMLCVAMVLFYQRLGENWDPSFRALGAGLCSCRADFAASQAGPTRAAVQLWRIIRQSAAAAEVQVARCKTNAGFGVFAERNRWPGLRSARY